MRITAILVTLAAWPLFVFAHQFSYGAIQTVLTLNGNKVGLETRAPLNLVIDPEYREKQRQLFEGVYQDEFQIESNGSKCVFKLEDINKLGRGPEVTFSGEYDCPQAISTSNINIRNILFREYFQNYDHFVKLQQGSISTEVIFNADKLNYGNGGGDQKGTDILNQFLSMGIAHILTGFDHILFLISVILLARGMRRILILVTSFTVAHSITLILSAFHVASFPPGVVEPLIALSIAFVAIRNIWQIQFKTEGELGERWITVFLFGLIHGLGFARALTEANIPPQYFIATLVIFNVGIEVGQLGILFAVLPLLDRLQNFKIREKALVFLSSAIALLSIIWFVERII